MILPGWRDGLNLNRDIEKYLLKKMRSFLSTTYGYSSMGKSRLDAVGKPW
jgi:hypothetical protein